MNDDTNPELPRDRAAIDTHLTEAGVDGYCFDADGENSGQYYLTGFSAPDPFVSVYTQDGLFMLVTGLEYGRAKKESRAESVSRFADYDYGELREKFGTVEGRNRAIAKFLDEKGVTSIHVAPSFPSGTADGLREQDIAVAVDESDVLAQVRAQKTDGEIKHIRAAQRANERAMDRARELLTEASVSDGTLIYEGDVLTSERVKQAIEVALLRNGCGLDETIVACGEAGADPHDRGSGPLKAGEPIVIDIFPRSKETGYHADMTRTFVVGSPSDAVRDRYAVVRRARDAGIEAIEPGVTGAAVHGVVCDVIEDGGYVTHRSDPTAETGFIHSTGHGVGLDVHEGPRLGESGEKLKPGHVVTVEPGLYDPAHGGIRLEDLVVVTEDGCENLTEYTTAIDPGKD